MDLNMALTDSSTSLCESWSVFEDIRSTSCFLLIATDKLKQKKIDSEILILIFNEFRFQ